MRDGHDAIDISEAASRILETGGEFAGEGAGAGIRPKNDDIIPRADPAARVAWKTEKGRWRGGGRDLGARAESRFVERKRQAVVDKIRRVWQWERDVAFAKDPENFLVADVLARFDIPEGQPKGKSPGKQSFAFANAVNREAMPLQNCVGKFEHKLPEQNARAGWQITDRNSHVVTSGRNASSFFKGQRFRSGGRHRAKVMRRGRVSSRAAVSRASRFYADFSQSAA
jgi:hypothetical protein